MRTKKVIIEDQMSNLIFRQILLTSSIKTVWRTVKYSIKQYFHIRA